MVLIDTPLAYFLLMWFGVDTVDSKDNMEGKTREDADIRMFFW